MSGGDQELTTLPQLVVPADRHVDALLAVGDAALADQAIDAVGGTPTVADLPDTGVHLA